MPPRDRAAYTPLMSAYLRLLDVDNNLILPPRVRWCADFGCKLRGFILRRSITLDEGLVLVYPDAGRLGASIHMLGVFCALGVIWLNGDGIVVDGVVARPWRPLYAPRRPARYVLELHPSYVAQLPVGRRVQFVTA